MGGTESSERLESHQAEQNLPASEEFRKTSATESLGDACPKAAILHGPVPFLVSAPLLFRKKATRKKNNKSKPTFEAYAFQRCLRESRG